MRAYSFAVVVASLALWLSVPAAAMAQKQTPAEAILRSSDWSFTIDGAQDGGLRIRDGMLYPGDNRLNKPVGLAGFTPAGELSLRFQGHPKVATGTALVAKVAPSRWDGVLAQPGGNREFVMRRKR